MSRFLNVSPRAYIRQKDSKNVLPSTERTGYQNELRGRYAPFSDSDTTVIFQTGSVVLAPYMVPASLANLSGFYEGDLFLTASTLSRNVYLDRVVENDQAVPFREGSNPAAYSLGTENEGTPETLYPGFSSHENQKSAIVINITSTQAANLIKLNHLESARDPSGPFFAQRGSGFMYYNATAKRWIDAGVRDPSAGSLKSYNPVLSLNQTLASTNKFGISTANDILCQFSSTPYSITSEGPYYVPDTDALRARGYDKIGEPTSFFGAPRAARYHAPNTSTIKMSNYITSPFVVDRISVQIPVTAFRTQTPGTGSATVDNGFGRDIDNYVFFVYIQNRIGFEKDSVQDVSSSLRYLIGKKSFCFYNQPTLDEVESGLSPIHDIGHSSSFSMQNNVATLAGTAIMQSISTRVNMTFRPQTFNSTFGALSKLPGSVFISSTSERITGSVFIQNFWKGGQLSDGEVGPLTLIGGTSNLNSRSGSIPTVQKNVFITPSPRALAASFFDTPGSFITSGSGISETGVELSTVTNDSFYKETPVILFPEDELVFGIESGVNSNMLSPSREYTGLDNDVLHVTGSYLKIDVGDAKVVLFGSTVVQNREKLPILNQYLGSDAVHEDIHEEGPFDEFDIFAKNVLTGSYIDNIFEGSLFNRTRTGSNVRDTGGTQSSFQRNIRFSNSQSTYYDSLTPVVSIISGGIANTSDQPVGPTEIGLNLVEPQTLKIIQDTDNGFAFDNGRANGVLLKRSFTFENSTLNSKRTRNFKLKLYNSSSTIINSNEGLQARYSLYYNGRNPLIGPSSKNYQGASSLRYGLVNIRPLGPSNIFRRDRFGQFRDMLEQSRDSKTITNRGGKDTISPPVVIATFVSASSDTVTDGIFTQCSNLSTECTSSIPFTDSIARNRGDDVPATKAKFGPNNLIFGVTGSFGMQ